VKVRLKVQRHLVVGYLDGDPGDWVFTVCRSGMSKLLNEKLKPNDELLIELEGEVIASKDDEDRLRLWLRETPTDRS
jgi:hypothetical protein